MSNNMSKEDFNRILKSGLQEINLDYDKDIAEKLYHYMNYLIEENKKYNLTAIDTPVDIISKHFFDSLIFFNKFKPEKGTKVIDVGTGAGFPGMVMKIYRPDLELLLLDSLNKRINFLDTLINDLELNGTSAIHARAEELASDKLYREKFNIAVSRAVASMNTLSEYTIPFVKKGGKVVFFKGPDYSIEMEDSSRAVELLGGKFKEIHKVNIPGVEGDRYLLEIEKVDMTPLKYPRRPGIPKKRPL